MKKLALFATELTSEKKSGLLADRIQWRSGRKEMSFAVTPPPSAPAAAPTPPSSQFTQKDHHIPTLSNPEFTQKSILNLLNTKCANSLHHLKQVHALILKTQNFHDHYIAGTLVKCYANPSFSSLECAVKVFDKVPQPNVFVWNSIIKGFMDNKQSFQAIRFYRKMVAGDSKPNKYTYPPLIKACTALEAVEAGLQIHAQLVKHGLRKDRHIKSSGIQMYASFGRVMEARNMFDDGLEESDVVCWNAMIDGYMKCGNVEEACKLFNNIPSKSIGSWNAMVSGLARRGMIEKARETFDKMPEKDDISWSSMIDGYNKKGYFKEGLEIFQEMQRERVKPEKFVLSSVLSGCANLGALDQGRWIHTYIQRNSIPLDAVLGSSLLDMYAQCGRIDLAWDVFENMKHTEVFSWNAMIGGLAIHGRADDAMKLLSKMQNQKVKPNHITFVGILSACAHAGLVDAGLKFLHCMKLDYGIEPTVEHFGCVVDLLGRAGLLTEACELISSMPMEPDAAVWGALLGACKKYGNADIGERVGNILLDLEPQNGGRYALLSNIYAKAGRWEDVSRLRKLMKERGVKTRTGRSTIDLNGTIHEFKIGDGSHPQMKLIYLMLESVMEQLKSEGYSPNTSQVLNDISEEEKESELKYHSEKLAIGFGLLNTKPGETIRVVKNLRICDDCHASVKLISKLYGREIIMRDRVRYHHFRDGSCSCLDFW